MTSAPPRPEQRLRADVRRRARAPRSSAAARWRLALRLAWRQVRRAWASSLLVVSLILLPMALAAGALVYVDTATPSAETRVASELGRADAWIEVDGGADPTRRQYLDEPRWVEREPGEDGAEYAHDGPVPSSPREEVPDVGFIEIARGDAAVESAGGIAEMSASIGNAWSPILEGAFGVLSGRAPERAGEAMATPAALERIGIEVGDSVRLVDGPEYEVVGTLARAGIDESVEQLFLPSADGIDGAEPRTWYAPSWRPTADDVYALNEAGFVVFARDLVRDPGDGASPNFDADSGSAWAIATAFAAGLVFSAYVVMLLAGAAFAVTARRQQRALAVVASVGATRADMQRIVLLQGTILGLVGGVLGAAVGVAGTAVLASSLDTVAYRPALVAIPWAALVGLVAFAALIGTLTALLPARAASRIDVLAALRGARRPVRVSAKRPLWGIVLILAGVALTAVSAITIAAEWRASGGLLRSQTAFLVGAAGMLAGPLVAQVGAILAGHWILAGLSRLVARLGAAPRLAGRDAVANPSRVVPAFGAVAACAFLATGAFGGASILTAERQASWNWEAPPGSVIAEMGPSGAGYGAVVAEAVRILDEAGADDVGVDAVQAEPFDPETGALDEGAAVIRPQMADPAAACDDGTATCDEAFWALIGNGVEVGIVAADDLAPVLGVHLGATEARAYEGGGALALTDRWIDDTGAIAFHAWPTAVTHGGEVPETLPEPLETMRIPAVRVDAPVPMSSFRTVFISPAAAEALGVETGRTRVIGSFDGGPAAPQIDGMRAAAAEYTNAASSGEVIGVREQAGPPDAGDWLWLTLAATAVLVVGASAIALGLARVERRPDDATLTAVGAPNGVRRGVAFWQAAIITGVGCAMGTAAGMLPVLGAWAVLEGTRGAPLALADLPWEFVGILAIGLPLAVALVSAAVRPAATDMTRRTAIA